jgi:hypothetical protein
MNQAYIDDEVWEWEKYYAHPSIMGGKLMNIRCPPNTL